MSESFKNIPVVLILTFRAKCRNAGTAVGISSLQHTPSSPPFHHLGSLPTFHVVVISEYFLLSSSNLDQAKHRVINVLHSAAADYDVTLQSLVTDRVMKRRHKKEQETRIARSGN